jgi:5'-deoxynucleotidase YfbR-like HD superfamily hydrolase
MWKEFSSNQTKEARLVKQLDKVEMFLQANQYLKNGYSYEFLSPFLHVLDNIGRGEIKEKDDHNFQSNLENILKHLR